MTLLNILFWNISVQPVSSCSTLTCYVLYLFSAIVVLYQSLFLADLMSFKKRGLNMIHVDQLNAIAHHTGLGDNSQFNHPRATHNLLGYTTDCTSFTERSSHFNGLGGQLPNGQLSTCFTSSTTSWIRRSRWRTRKGQWPLRMPLPISLNGEKNTRLENQL